MVDINKLVESYYPADLNWDGMLQIIEEQIDALSHISPSSNSTAYLMSEEKGRTGVESGYQTQALRIPLLVATEISIGQKPGSEAREMMELWFRNIKPEGTLEEKITAIADFVRKPPTTVSIAETLSYLMFLQSFAYILKEFNPSVAGYLWEPLLAVLFGGRGKNASVQVPTTEHDISDIRIFYDEKLQPLSLKILRKEGPVGGSFVDLVKFFGGRVTGKPEEKMTYVVIAKVAPKKTVNTMAFYKFELTRQTFMDWIGHKKVDVKTVWRQKEIDFGDSRRENLDWRKENGWYIPHAGIRGMQQKGGEDFPWLKVFDKYGKALTDATRYMTLDNTPVEKGAPIDLHATYEAQIPHFTSGGRGGRSLKITNTFLDEYIKKAYEIWGDPEDLARWQELAADPTVDFFGAVMNGIDYNFSDGSTHLNAAPGFVKKEQFEISASYYQTKENSLGAISIDDNKIRETFKAGAKICGENLTNIFNSLAALTDNVARFFLVDCGDNKCGKKDAERRAEEGAQAAQNAAVLKKSVDAAVQEEPEDIPIDQGDDALTT